MGCAGQSAETERQLQRMQDRVAILQNERDRLDERVSALEQQQQLWQSQRAQEQTGALLQRPALKVVRLEPESPDSSAPQGGAAKPSSNAPSAQPQSAVAQASAADDDGERVLISGTGDKLTATHVTGGSE